MRVLAKGQEGTLRGQRDIRRYEIGKKCWELIPGERNMRWISLLSSGTAAVVAAEYEIKIVITGTARELPRRAGSLLWDLGN